MAEFWHRDAGLAPTSQDRRHKKLYMINSHAIRNRKSIFIVLHQFNLTFFSKICVRFRYSIHKFRNRTLTMFVCNRICCDYANCISRNNDANESKINDGEYQFSSIDFDCTFKFQPVTRNSVHIH